MVSKIPHVLKSYHWFHLMYINQLSEFNNEYLSLVDSNILSCDVCGGVDDVSFDISLLKFFDFVFLSESDINVSIELLKKHVKGYIIIHDSRSCKLVNKDMEKEFDVINVLNNINVLGAGDYFAASFIYYMMDKSPAELSDIEEAIRYSQDSVYKRLKSE